ncbi:hypothetical protein LEMLEM_LOCUS18413 [Lemmus lemmus]
MRGAPGARAAGGSWRCRCCCCCWRETVRASLRRSTGTTAPGQRFSRNSWKPWTPMLPPWAEGTAAAQAGQAAIPARSWRRARAHFAGACLSDEVHTVSFSRAFRACPFSQSTAENKICTEE